LGAIAIDDLLASGKAEISDVARVDDLVEVTFSFPSGVIELLGKDLRIHELSVKMDPSLDWAVCEVRTALLNLPTSLMRKTYRRDAIGRVIPESVEHVNTYDGATLTRRCQFTSFEYIESPQQSFAPETFGLPPFRSNESSRRLPITLLLAFFGLVLIIAGSRFVLRRRTG
jgi:hypothetical protein